MTSRSALLVALLAALPFVGAAPETPDTWGAPALLCDDVCWTATPGDGVAAGNEVLGTFILHERTNRQHASYAATRESARVMVPILIAGADAELSDDECCEPGGDTRAVGTTRALHLIASGAPGVVVFDASRMYNAAEAGGAGSSTDATQARDGARAATIEVGGDAAVTRTARYDPVTDRTIETVKLHRWIQVGEQRTDVNMTLRLESDRAAGVAWLTIRGNAGARFIDERAFLPLDLP